MKHYRYRMEQQYDEPYLNIEEYNVFKETPGGYWIGIGEPTLTSISSGLRGKLRWVSKNSRKRYAYPTKKEALHNFLMRTKKRIAIVESILYACKKGIKDAENIKTDINWISESIKI